MFFASSRPRVVFLADKRNWAFDFVARSVAARLSGRYNISIKFSNEDPDLAPEDYDILYVFFWGENRYKKFDVPRGKLIKEVASHRWETSSHFGKLSASSFVRTYLDDCGLVTTPSRALYDRLSEERDNVFLCPNGIELGLFYPGRPRTGPLKIGWVGNPQDRSKGLEEILLPATATFDFSYSPGNWSRAEVIRFYQNIDVLAIASIAESQPLPLMEAMACGCFPVTTAVGIVPELVESGRNGLVVDRDADAFREAFTWCQDHLDEVRAAGLRNAALVAQERSWDRLAERFDAVFAYALDRQRGRTTAPPPEVPFVDAPAPPLTKRRHFDALRWRVSDTKWRMWAQARRGALRSLRFAHRLSVFASERLGRILPSAHKP